jgi:hypothetical protein
MFHADSPRRDAAADTPADADLLLDESFLDPAQDDYLDRCLFDYRQRLTDFRDA